MEHLLEMDLGSAPMKHILFLSLSLAVFSACPAVKKGCKETGCSAGAVCNATSGVCEVTPVGGGGGTTGGGAGGGSGGGSGGGAIGGGGNVDAGVDAGQPIDPFDDGGVFAPGDICNYAIPVRFDGGLSADGGPALVVTLSVDLAAETDQYKAVCNTSSGTGNDALFQITLTEPKGLIVSTTDTSGKTQDAVLALVNSPCPLMAQGACVDNTGGGMPEVLSLDRVPAGTYYVLIENYAADNLGDGTYDVQFELVEPVAGPPNDACSGAQPLTFTNGMATATGTTVGAFNDTAGSPLTCSANSARNPEVFYTLTLTQSQDVTVTVVTPTGSNLSPAFSLTNTCGVGGAMNQRGCRTGAGSTFTTRSVPAGTYFIVVDGNDPVTGAFTLNVTLAPPTPALMNDTCATPTTLVPNVSQMVDANAGARDYMFSCAGGTGGDVVYQFTTTMPQKVTLTATGMGGADAVLSLRAAPCDTSTNEVACVDNQVSAPEVITVVNLPAGTYYVVLAAFSQSSGQFGLALVLDAPTLPPPNETCATPATLVPNVSQAIDLGAAASDYTLACSNGGFGGDAVYQFTTTQAQRVVVTATGVGDTDPVLALRGAPCATSIDLVCSNSTGAMNPEVLIQNNLPAGTYFVIVRSDGTNAQLLIQLALEPPRPPPSNDTCTLPEVVTLAGGTAMRSVDLGIALPDITSDLCGTFADGADVVYQVTIPLGQTLTVVGTPVGTMLDPVLFAKSPVCTMATSEVCADVGASGTAETLVIPNTTGIPKLVFVVVKAYRLASPGVINLVFTAM